MVANLEGMNLITMTYTNLRPTSHMNIHSNYQVNRLSGSGEEVENVWFKMAVMAATLEIGSVRLKTSESR